MSSEETEVQLETSHNKSLGAKGEEAAARYLEGKAYEIIDRN